MAEEKKKLRVDVISDAVCPWCFIGKKRLEQAIAQRADRYDVEVRWHPYMLNPDVPAEGTEARAYYERRFGSWERFLQMTERVRAIGAEEGIAFDFEKSAHLPNTHASHRLVWMAGGTGRQNEVVEKIFSAHFVEGRNVGDVEVLVELAAGAGLDPDEIRAGLQGDAGKAEIDATLAAVQQMGVTGVPFFVIAERFAFSGAQPVETFVEALDRAAAGGEGPTAA